MYFATARRKSAMQGILKKVADALRKFGMLYCSYEYGTEERKISGRFFSDYTENDISALFKDIGLKCEKWMNIMPQKLG